MEKPLEEDPTRLRLGIGGSVRNTAEVIAEEEAEYGGIVDADIGNLKVERAELNADEGGCCATDCAARCES